MVLSAARGDRGRRVERDGLPGDAHAAAEHARDVPDPHLMARLTILIKLLGGFAVILGAFVAIVRVPIAAVLFVAMFKVHLPYGFSSIKFLAVTAAGAKFGPVGCEVNLSPARWGRPSWRP